MPRFLWLWFPRTSAQDDDSEEEEEREVHPSVVAASLCGSRVSSSVSFEV